MLKVLVACEESQRVCTAFRELGHEAYSADIQEPSGGHPEWHILGDVLKVLKPFGQLGLITFKTMDNTMHVVKKWDIIIAHPPCTHLAVSGARWFKEGVKPISLQDQAADFFMKFINAECEHIAVENPVCVMSTRYRKPDQIINPWQFGHLEQKKTCLWLKNLPKLQETNNVYEEMMKLPEKERAKCWWLGSNHSKERSKTYFGIAKAIAEQYSEYVENSTGLVDKVYNKSGLCVNKNPISLSYDEPIKGNFIDRRLKMTEVICDYDFCKHYENGRCGLDTVEICGGHCQDIDDEQED